MHKSHLLKGTCVREVTTRISLWCVPQLCLGLFKHIWARCNCSCCWFSAENRVHIFDGGTTCNKPTILKKKKEKKITPKNELKQICCLWSSYKQAEVLIYWSIFAAEMNYTIGHATVKPGGNCNNNNKKNQQLSLNCEGCWQMSRKRYDWCQTRIKDWFNSQSNCCNCLFFFFFPLAVFPIVTNLIK